MGTLFPLLMAGARGVGDEVGTSREPAGGPVDGFDGGRL